MRGRYRTMDCAIRITHILRTFVQETVKRRFEAQTQSYVYGTSLNRTESNEAKMSVDATQTESGEKKRF
uniref:Ovule protein n=1 Tax=Steinernema glaseri TaxID=37863 RepID=A0A1I7YH32_9BILA